jgi:hypothetical protein
MQMNSSQLGLGVLGIVVIIIVAVIINFNKSKERDEKEKEEEEEEGEEEEGEEEEGEEGEEEEGEEEGEGEEEEEEEEETSRSSYRRQVNNTPVPVSTPIVPSSPSSTVPVSMPIAQSSRPTPAPVSTPIAPSAPPTPVQVDNTPVASPPGNPRYVGCYVDTGTRAMGPEHGRFNSRIHEQCLDVAKSKNHKYYGIQDRNSCYTHNTYDKYGAGDNCNTCEVNKKCGGGWRNAVYEVNPNSQWVAAPTPAPVTQAPVAQAPVASVGSDVIRNRGRVKLLVFKDMLHGDMKGDEYIKCHEGNGLVCNKKTTPNKNEANEFEINIARAALGTTLKTNTEVWLRASNPEYLDSVSGSYKSMHVALKIDPLCSTALENNKVKGCGPGEQIWIRKFDGSSGDIKYGDKVKLFKEINRDGGTHILTVKMMRP